MAYEQTPGGDGEQFPIGSIPIPKRPRENIEVFSIATENKELIAEMIKDLAGVVVQYDEEQGGLVMVQTPYSIVNMEGARKIFQWVKGLINPVSSLTWLDDEEIAQQSKSTCENFYIDMFENSHKIGLVSGNYLVLCTNFTNLCWNQLKASKDGKKAEHLLNPKQRIQQDINTTEDKRSGVKLPFTGKSSEQQ